MKSISEIEKIRPVQKDANPTDSRHHFPRYPNLIKGMVIDRLNQVWLADITYIRIRTGFVYLANTGRLLPAGDWLCRLYQTRYCSDPGGSPDGYGCT